MKAIILLPFSLCVLAAAGHVYLNASDGDADGARMAADIGPGATVMGDFWHMGLEETSFMGAFICAGKLLTHVHIAGLKQRIIPGVNPEADIYVDQNDRTTVWQLLHFGLQNLYDPNLDEWIKMTSWQHKPGRVVVPKVCR